MASIEASGLAFATGKRRAARSSNVSASSAEPYVQPWPRALRLALVLGLGTSSWAGVIALVRLAF